MIEDLEQLNTGLCGLILENILYGKIGYPTKANEVKQDTNKNLSYAKYFGQKSLS